MTHYTIVFRAFFSLLFAATVFLFGANSAFATVYEVTGWGWSGDDMGDGVASTLGGPGWISFSNKSDLSAIPYGVFIDGATGVFSGYAWSTNLGWITFNPFEMQKCTINPGDSCPGPVLTATISITSDPLTGVITGGTGLVSGWARSCSVFISGCSGPLRPVLQRGAWDGWISLAGTAVDSSSYGLRLNIAGMKFLGPNSLPACATCYAWAGGVANNSPFGWGINISGLDVSLVPSTVPPLLSFWADQTTLLVGQSTNLHWVTSSNISGCNSASFPTSFGWTGPRTVSSAPQNWTVGPFTTAGSYTFRLQCQDSFGVTTPQRDVGITILSEPIVINGACGIASSTPSRSAPSANLCETGNAGTVTQSGNFWRWTCTGINGGTNATCASSKKKAFQIIEI